MTRAGWLLASLGLAVVAELCIAPFVLFTVSVSLIPVGVGLVFTFLSTFLVRGVANLHRLWAGHVLGEPIPKPYLKAPKGSGPFTRLGTILRDPATWRDWAWLLVNATAGFTLLILSFSLFAGAIFYLIYPFLYAVTPPSVFGSNFGIFRVDDQATSFLPMLFGVVALVVWSAVQRPLMRADALLTKALLAPTEQAALRARVQQLAQTRTQAVDTSASELRRIERDLHDGAQARLVSMGMTLGLAEELLEHDPEAARRLMIEARESAGSALVELRDLVRGIHPPVLADRGLDGAVRALVLANPVPTDVAIDIDGRLPAPVESAAYFAVAEAVTNAIKHADASKLSVVLRWRDGRLIMQVSDNGRGGADARLGTGIRGIERRLAAFDGTLTVDSPVGGPTDVRMSLPCDRAKPMERSSGLSSPKTSPSSATG